MPELPEVETVKRALCETLAGVRVAKVELRRKDLRIPFPDDLAVSMQGKKVENVFRRGKYILIALESGRHVVMHLGMSGRIKIMNSAEWKAPHKHDHFIVHTAHQKICVLNDPRRFGMVFTTGPAWDSHEAFRNMGPEPLGNHWNAQVLKARFGDSKSPIKLALLDQRVVAGLGNIYVCEALYLAGLSPLKPAGQINIEECERLVSAIRDILSRAIEAGGSTLRDYSQANGETGYFQFAFSVYDREGRVCRRCSLRSSLEVEQDHRVIRIVQSGRSTFYCPGCQS